MAEFVRASGDEMAFFKGRQWISRGVRYPEDNSRGDSGGDDLTTTTTTTAAESAESTLTAAVAEVELAYHESRLRSAVDKAVDTILQRSSSTSGVGGGGVGDGGNEELNAAVTGLRSAVPGEVVAAVDTLCALAASVGGGGGGGGDGSSDDAAARDALEALVGFAGSGEGPVAARRAAVAFLGEKGDVAGEAGLEAIAAVFRGDKSPGVRRTAGDALRYVFVREHGFA